MAFGVMQNTTGSLKAGSVPELESSIDKIDDDIIKELDKPERPPLGAAGAANLQ